MRIIKPDSGFLVYQKIFKQLMANHSKLVIWQLLPETGKREIHDTHLSSFNTEALKLHFQLLPEVKITPRLPLYFYAEDGQFIFKCQIEDMRDNSFTVQMPAEIKLLEDPEITLIRGQVGLDLSDIWRTKRLNLDPVDIGPDYMKVKSLSERSSRDQEFLKGEFGMTLEEEDKIFAGQRETPRARPKTDKWVKVAKFRSDGPKLYKLFDLSQGGMAFLSNQDLEFDKGNDIHIVGFDQFDLDDPLLGKVMSVRPVDGAQSEFKVGVKFSDGQN